MRPRVRFTIDPKQDIRAYDRFQAERVYDGGRSLRWAVVNRYPQFRNMWGQGTLRVGRKEILAFIRTRYKNNDVRMKQALKLYEQNWRSIERYYHQLVGTLFPNPIWPTGKYRASLTIWGLCPKFLEDSTFLLPAFPQKSTHGNVIIAHEMLHFIFFRYFFRWFPKYRSDHYEMVVWHASEIFNSVVQNSSEWIRIFRFRSILYPEHRRIVGAVLKRIGENKLTAQKITIIILDEIKKRRFIVMGKDG